MSTNNNDSNEGHDHAASVNPPSSLASSPSTPTPHSATSITTGVVSPMNDDTSEETVLTPSDPTQASPPTTTTSSSTPTARPSGSISAVHSRQSSAGASSVIYHPSSTGTSTPVTHNTATRTNPSSSYTSPSVQQPAPRPTGILLPSSSSTPAPSSSRHSSVPTSQAPVPTRRTTGAYRETYMATDTDLESLASGAGRGAASELESNDEADDDDEGYFASKARATASTLVPPSPGPLGSYASAVSGKMRAVQPPTPGPSAALRTRSTSVAPPSSSRRATARSVSRARMNEDDEGFPPERAMSPVPPREFGLGDDKEDDEVSVRDRGEELVRKRMKERHRVKKEAEKAATRKREAERAAALRRTTSSSYYDPAHDTETVQTIGIGPPPDVRSRSMSRPGLRDSHASSSSNATVGAIAAQAGGGAGLDRRVSTATTTGYEEEGFSGRVGSVAPTKEGETWSPMFPGRKMTQRGKSYSSSARGGPVDVFSDRALEEEASVEAGAPEGEQGERMGEGLEMDEEEGTGGAHETEDGSDDEDIDDADVEYTLKDRQDAINVEHPFGLPIWKPALYKKDRSITRNAEKALHDVPSSTAVRHLAPGNLLWTVFFGLILFSICTLVAGLLWCVPWGGKKYGRVVWELGGYLFWPFGKYVEGWTDEFDDEVSSEGDPTSSSANGHGVIEEHPDEEEEQDRASLRRDLESAGGTYGRGRGRDRSTSPLTTSTPQRNVSDYSSAVGDASETHLTVRGMTSQSSLRVPSDSERDGLLSSSRDGRDYGATTSSPQGDKLNRGSSEATVAAPSWRPHDFSKDDPDHARNALRVRALGRTMYWITFYLVIAPVLFFVCVLCWGLVFTIPMAKLLWVLLRHLNNEPLSLHFRSPPKYNAIAAAAPTEVETRVGTEDLSAATTINHGGGISSSSAREGVQYPLVAGQRAPPVSRKSVAAAKRHGRLIGPHSTVLLCTYHAMGAQYYKYTIDGVNILFINLMSLVFFVIFDFFYLAPRVAQHHLGGLLAFITSQACIFVLALLSVIPLSYFIGMAVASISAQSSIGMGAVINASFGSIIEIILYSIALTQAKGELVEGSIVGSILAGVLLMPGASMIGGAMRRKEQKFNARSAGVTSTMLIMAIIGILTPTMFYEIYGSFQLTCTECDPDHRAGTSESCRTCYYEHINPADDPFYKSTVKALSYYCAVLLVLSYLIGLWFSLRTHASQIWQNAQPKHEPLLPRPSTAPGGVGPASAQGASTSDRASIYKRLVPSQLLPRHRSTTAGGQAPGHDTPLPDSTPTMAGTNLEAGVPPMVLPEGMTADELHRAFEVVAATGVAIGAPAQGHPSSSAQVGGGAALHRSTSHAREVSGANTVKGAEHDGAGAEGGHDAPNWSRMKSASVLMSCTVLYAIIAEILVDVVDVVLDGSGIPEKFLGVTLFALVPNTTEFMNAISFAINGNIALSMEIGSAYALQVCLIQAPAMLAFSAIYGIGKETLLHRSFTLVFPRWDVIAIMFSVFLLTYTYIEARANYYRGSILCLSYLVLMGGFAFAPAGRDTSDNPGLWSLKPTTSDLSIWEHVLAICRTLFSR